MIEVLSLGAGVQSTAVALLAAHGQITPMPDCAIFSDTGWEPQAVYEHLAWLMSANVLPFPVHIVRAGDLRKDALSRSNTTGQRFAAIPWHVRNPDGTEGLGRRQCTKEYKLRPLQRQVRAMLGGKVPKAGARVWIGISTDEIVRVKPSRLGYIVNRHPLIELRMNRNDCLQWLRRNGYPQPPRSACIGCPFNSNDRWRALLPHEFADAVEVDEAIRLTDGYAGELYAHRSLVPLQLADISTAADRGQSDLFGQECEGMCGV